MKTIIVPIDFSEESRSGLDFALVLARQFKSEVQMVYVQNPKPDFAHVGIEVERRKAQEAFEEIIREYTPRLPEGVVLKYIIKKGKVYEEVVDQARARTNAVIVTSTHGASGFQELFVGSNTLRMLAASDIPLFTIREGITATGVSNIVFPLDTTFESRQKAPYVGSMAKAFGAVVHVVGILQSPNDETRQRLARYIDQVKGYFDSHKIETRTTTLDNMDLVDGSLAYAAKLPDALITVSTENKVSLPLFMIGSKAQRMLSRAEVPILCLAPTVKPLQDSFRTLAG